MVHKTELYSLHILDLLELLDAEISGEGSLILTVNGEESHEFDFHDLCLVLKVVSQPQLFARENLNDDVIPIATFRRGL